MEFNQLEIFLAIERHKSFSKAAEELYLSQPTVSNNIQSLERELGTTLINRTARDISLTPSGEVFYKYAQEILNLRDQAKHSISEHSKKVEGPIRLMASSMPQQYILPYLIRDFKKVYPEVCFIVTESKSKKIIDEIQAGKLNHGIIGLETRSRALDKIAIHEDGLVLATSMDFNQLESFSQPLDMEDLLEEDFLFRKRDSGTRVFVEESLKKIGIDPGELKVSSTLDSNAMIKKMVELGQGLAILPRISIENELRLGLLKAFDIRGMETKRKFYFVYSKYRTLPPSVQAFKDFLEDWPGIDK